MATENLPAFTSSLLPAQQEFQMFQTIARSAKNSGLYGGDENKIFMVLLAARELGISPLIALNGGIWNIQNKIEISARLMNSMIRRAGHTMQITSNAKECVIKGKRVDTGEEHIETFTIEMAERAGLASGNVWKKYPEDMLYNRCMSRLARRLFPDVIGTAYVEGEVKEAKEIERQELQQASYEEINPNTEILPKSTELVKTQLPQDKLDLILDTCKLADPKCVENMNLLLKENYNIDFYSDMSLEAFDRCMDWLNRNIEMKKKKAVA